MGRDGVGSDQAGGKPKVTGRLRPAGRGLLAIAAVLVIVPVPATIALQRGVPRVWVSEEFRCQVESANDLAEIGLDPWGSPWHYWSSSSFTFPDQVWSAGPDRVFSRSGDDVLLLYLPPSLVVAPRGPPCLVVEPSSDSEWWLLLVPSLACKQPLRIGLGLLWLCGVLNVHLALRRRACKPWERGLLGGIAAAPLAFAAVGTAQEVHEMLRVLGSGLPAWPTPVAVCVGVPVWATAGACVAVWVPRKLEDKLPLDLK